MLSSFFSKSKPINYIAVALYMSLLFSLAYYKNGFIVNWYNIFLLIVGLVLYILPMIILNFMVQKNDLTDKGSYTILLYAFFTSMLPNSLTNLTILISSVFILLALRSLLHLRTGKSIKANLFNASIWVGIASLAFFWSIGFVLLVFLAVSYFEPKNYRNWIIPCIGLLLVYVFANCFTLAVYDSFFTFSEYVDSFSFSFQNYVVKDQLFSVGIVSICILFFLSVYLLKFSRKKANVKPILRLIIAYLFIAIAIAGISPEKNTSELFFTVAPLAIIGSTYLEMDYNWLAKEINIWVFVLLPFTILLF